MKKTTKTTINTGERNYKLKEEITLKFNIDNILLVISNIKTWTNFSEKDFLNKNINELFDGDILAKYINSIERVKNGNIEYLYYEFDNYDYQVLLSPHYIEAKYNGFIAIISRFKLENNVSKYYEDYYSIFDDNKKCVAIFQAINEANDFIIVGINKSAEKLENISRTDVIGKNILDVFANAMEVGLLDVFKRVIKSGKSEKLDPIYFNDDTKREYRYFEVFKFSENKIIAIYNDITLKKELESILNENIYEFNLVDNLKSEGVIFIKNDIILKINQKAIDILGYNNNREIIGNNIYDYVNTKYTKLIRQYIESKSVKKFNILAKHKRNTQLILEGYAKKITYGYYDNIYVFFIRDITKETENNKKLKLLSTAVEQSANSVIITNSEGNIEYINPYFTKITGYTLEEVMGENPRILKSGYQSDDFYKELWDTISNGKVWNGIFNNKTKDGILYWEKSTITPIIDDNNHITNYIAIKENITKEYLQEIALESSEKKFKDLISRAIVPMIVLNSEGNLDFVNDSMYRLIGSENDNQNLLYTSYNVFKDQQLISLKVSDSLKKLFQGENIDIPIINYDLSNINFLTKQNIVNKKQQFKAIALPVKNENGKINQAVIMFEDFTERKIHEMSQSVIFNIIKAGSRAESIAELVKIVKTEIGRLIDTSNFFVGLYDKDKDFFTVPYFADEKDNYKEFPAANTLSKYVIETKKPLLANNEKKQQLMREGKLTTQGSESKIWLGVPLIVNNEAIGVYAVQNYANENAYTHNDIKLLEMIGEQISMSLYKKQIEENIIEQNIKLEAINKELRIEKVKAESSERLTNAFLANMSHEIRTPMNGIIGFTQLLQMPDIEKPQIQEYSQIIEQSGNRLLNIINELLDISKIEANKMTINKTRYNLNNQLVEIYKFFKPEADNKHIDLIYNINDACKPLEVYTDNDKLQAILTNLIKNALKYTKKGKIEFGCKIHKNEIEFYVSDTGIGIPKDRQKAIFDRFVQADLEDRDVYEGAGLGLSITQAYAKMLDGDISVESTVNKGSKFTVKIPMEIPVDIYEKSIKYINQSEIKANKKFNDFKINTLIVDDEKISYLYLSIALSDICEPLHYAQNSKEALEIIETNEGIELILMDIKMPGMSGYELTRIIKDKYPKIKIIAQTAFALEGDKEKALNAGCDGYIAKPLNHHSLKSLLKKVFKI